jgi:histone H3/H4
MQDNAIAALQTASEAFLVWGFEKSGLAASHVERKTVKKEDLDLILSLNNVD